jgi:hypothetical protein
MNARPRLEVVMALLMAFVLSAVLLAAAPGAPESNEGGLAPLAQRQAFAVAAGVLGAATACDEIAHDQVAAAASEVAALATAGAISVEEVASIDRLLMVSAAAGRQALQEGKTDCKTVQASFHELEKIVLQTPVALRRE